MGYTEIWKIKSVKRWEAVWPRLVSDARTILEAADMDLTSDYVWDRLDASRQDGDPEDAMRKLLDPPPPIADEEEGILFNGIQDDGCEPFYWERVPKLTGYTGCKTNERPYTAVVDAILIRAKQLLGDAFSASFPDSFDDSTAPWEQAVHLIRVLWPDDELPDPSLDDFDAEYIESALDENKPISLPTIKDIPIHRRQEHGVSEQVVHGKCFAQILLSSELDMLVHTISNWIQHSSMPDYQAVYPRHPRRNPPRLMRLIDTDKCCIVVAPQKAKYAALSYVWGKCRQVKLLTDNVHQLTQHYGICNYGLALPKTIADAIALCRRLGFRYLWADVLCIVQDSPQDKLFQLNRMRDVYSNAEITIVAACGEDADTGLYTTDSRSDATRHTSESTWQTEIHGLEDLYRNAIAKSLWDTRGWTFQEQLLSRRLLLFTSDGPFFHCGTCVYSMAGYQKLDSSALKGGTSDISRPGYLFDIEPGHQLETYLAVVQLYSQRKLTLESDAENAMKGITRLFGYAMDNKNNNFFHGIPTSAIDQLICWRAAQHEPDKRRDEFPSWSWYGWRQTPLFPEALIEGIKKKKDFWGSLIMGYDRHRDASGKDWGGNELDTYGINDSGATIPLQLTTKGGTLEVSMDSKEDASATNGTFQVLSPINGQVAGSIQLDKQWRAGEPAQMSFIPILTTSGSDGIKVTMLMCLKLSEKGHWGKTGTQYERVQIMDCSIGEADWKEMVGEGMRRRDHILLN